MRQLTILPLAAPDGLGSLARTVAAESMDNVLGLVGPETCLALTEDPALAALAQERNIHTAKAPVGHGEEILRLLPEARRQLRAFAQAARTKDATVLIVNPLNPLLTAPRLRLAVRAFRKVPDVPLVSVRVCRNHPCQFRRYMNLVQVDALHFLDHAWTAEQALSPDVAQGMVASRPFTPHRHERNRFQAKPGMLLRCQDAQPLATPENGLAALFQTDGLARLVFTPGQRLLNLPERRGARRGGFRLAGIAGSLRESLALFEGGHLGERLLLLTQSFPHRPELLLRLIPFSTVQTFWEQTTDILVTRLDQPQFVRDTPPPDTVGYLVCVFEAVREAGEYATHEMFAPPLAPWSVQGNKVFNRGSDREIHGRQAFPEVVRPDGSLAVLPLGLALGDGWSLKDARAYTLQDKESLIVTDQIEYLRLIARRQAEAAKRHTP